jgi:hypothetical protein
MQKGLFLMASKNIDKTLWNKCVATNNAPIYCLYQYINCMSNSWMGIVFGNYDAVMPICIKSKYFIKYCYTPAFMQQLGIVGQHNLSIGSWLQFLFTKIKYGDLAFNNSNQFLLESTCVEAKINFVLPLIKPYDNIKNNYSLDIIKNLKKASTKKLKYCINNYNDQYIDLYSAEYGHKMQKTTSKDFNNFKTLCSQFASTNNCIVRTCTNEQNAVLAVAVLLSFNNTLYLLANTITAQGRLVAANHFLIDNIIQEFANSNFTLDFEGSSLKGVYEFYKNFGGENKPYFHYHFNRYW